MKEIIANLLSKQLKLPKEQILSLIEIPKEEYGDYAFPCFILTSKLRLPPQEIAIELARKLKSTNEIKKIQATGPYINFFINKKILAEQVLKINLIKAKNKEKIILEHTSVNPNAAPHVGRTRNSFIGDSIKRILQFQGHKVETHYYINDVSKQVAILALNFKPKDNFDDLLRKYVEISKKIKQNPELEKKVFILLHKFEHKDKETTALFNKIVDIAIKGQKEIFKNIGINFDYFDYESKYLSESKNILASLDKTGKLFKDKENRIVLNQKGTGLEIKMKAAFLVLTRNDGTGLYPLRDLAYTIEKCKKGRNIIILGEDQKLYFEQIKQALILLKKPYPQVVHYSFVLIQTDSGTQKMSTRAGELVLLEEFISEAVKKARIEIVKRKTSGNPKTIAIAAVKYAMLRNENNKNIIFDWNQALNFEGDSGPYLLYSYARASSILRKAKKKKSKIIIPEPTENEVKLIKKILSFQETLEQAYKNLAPSLIANYSFELAQIFNEFYHANKVLGSEEESFRLALVEKFRETLKTSLSLLGIDVLERM